MRARTSWPAERPEKQVLDRRRRERTPTNGEVVLYFEDPEPVQICGRLIDLSPDGFRARHSHTALHAGQLVSFRHMRSLGSARVVWNCILGDRVESGFRILKPTTK